MFLFQGLLAWIISFPLLVAITSQELGIGLEYLGYFLWVVGFLFETIGDQQLANFKDNPASKGQVLNSGLWRYTRHPNYFGEACLWWGYYCIASSVGGWYSLFGPLLMTFLLLKVSGVALLEKTIT